MNIIHRLSQMTGTMPLLCWEHLKPECLSTSLIASLAEWTMKERLLLMNSSKGSIASQTGCLSISTGRLRTTTCYEMERRHNELSFIEIVTIKVLGFTLWPKMPSHLAITCTSVSFTRPCCTTNSAGAVHARRTFPRLAQQLLRR